jgi:dehydrogenase/reductase SDR family protein 12
MPSFRQKMENKLRTPEEGADTLVWMCCYQDLEKMERGAFFQGNTNHQVFFILFENVK